MADTNDVTGSELLKDLTGSQLLSRLDQLDQSLRNYRGKEDTLAHKALILERWNIRAEIVDRMNAAKEAIAAYDKARLKERMEGFSFAAGVAMSGLWQSHGGRDLTHEETRKLADLLFGFFIDIR